MVQLVNQLFSTERYSRQIEKNRARTIYAVVGLIAVLYGVYGLFVDSSITQRPVFLDFGQDALATFAILSVYGLGLVAVWAVREGHLTFASFMPSTMIYVGVCLLDLPQGYVFSDDAIMLAVVIMFSGLFVSVRNLLVLSIIVMATFLIGYSLRPELNLPEAVVQATTTQLYTVPLELIGVSVLCYLYMRRTSSQQLLDELAVANERLKSADISMQITRGVSQRLALAEVLNQTVDQIRDSYTQIYHAQIFLLDESRRNARLVASTGEAGRILLERRHSLEVGSISVIGQVTAGGESVIARSGSAETIHRRNEFLRDTRVEAAFPLRVGGEIIGALDMQSKYVDAFRADDAVVFQALADSIAVAIDNARLFEETEHRLSENQRLVEQTREAARQVERLNQALTERGWARSLRSWEGEISFGFDFRQRARQTEVDLTTAMQQALEQNQLLRQTNESGASVIAVPLTVRGQVIGAMEFELDASGQLSQEDIDLIQQVSERFGTVMENLRLYDESRRLAQREATVNEISTRLQRSNTIETVLTEAARSLHETLGADRVAIRLGAPPETNGVQRNGNN